MKSRVNRRGPPRKAKYSLATDSEQVPRGKGEKNRCERSEIVPEIMCLQGVGAQHFLIPRRAVFALYGQRVLRLRAQESET